MRRVCVALALAWLQAPAPAFASAGHPSSGAACAARVRISSAARDRRETWPSPLDRVVQVSGDESTLRATLDRLANASSVRLSYSPDLLPLDRSVCIEAERVALGDALTAVLAGTGVAPVIAGGNDVVLAPSRPAAAADAPPAIARSVGQLERVVVTGTATGAPERASPFGITVLDGKTLDRDASRSVAELLDGAVPGVWLWSQSPTTPVARYGSVRGASSFGATTPKIYIDGVEVANPLILTQLDPARIQSIEVIRGPQGAALYGADAISGVVNILTRHEATSTSVPRFAGRSSVGSARSDYVAGGVFTQDHSVLFRGGTPASSASLGVTAATIGSYIPGASSQEVLASASGRRVGTKTIVAGTARFAASGLDDPVSPLLSTLPSFDSLSTGRQAVQQYTVGATTTLLSSERWTHLFVAGLDGYKLSGISTEDVPIPSVTDSALRAAQGRADRLTLRASSTIRLGNPDSLAGSLTFGAEHSSARERLDTPPVGNGQTRLPSSPFANRSTTWWTNSGLLAQGQFAYRNRAFLTGGLRLERLTEPENGAQVTLLPMLGAALVQDRGDLAMKLRGAYGRGIRAARTIARGGAWGRTTTIGSLGPEQQSGVEAGFDILYASWLGLHVTRFDQLASGLVQPVTVLDTIRGGPGSGSQRLAYVLQNVGAIKNRGWELQGSSSFGALSVGATMTFVSSRVQRLASGYRGDLRRGDRMLEVPERTAGLTATWKEPRWSLWSGVSRASNWINYDRYALAEALALVAPGGTTSGPGSTGARPLLIGADLRNYWRVYEGVTHLNAGGSVNLWRSWSLTGAVNNLLDRQVGEPDNIQVMPGRTITIGLKTGY